MIESVTFSTDLASVYPPVCHISFFHLTLPSISMVPMYAVPSHGCSLLCLPPFALQSRSLAKSFSSPSPSLLSSALSPLADEEDEGGDQVHVPDRLVVGGGDPLDHRAPERPGARALRGRAFGARAAAHFRSRSTPRHGSAMRAHTGGALPTAAFAGSVLI